MAEPIAFLASGPIVKVTAGNGSSAVGNISTAGYGTVRVVNTVSTGLVFIKFGSATVTAATSDMPMVATSVETFTVPEDTKYCAAYGSAAAGDVYFCFGEGQ